jgi:hypothetical protein
VQVPSGTFGSNLHPCHAPERPGHPRPSSQDLRPKGARIVAPCVVPRVCYARAGRVFHNPMKKTNEPTCLCLTYIVHTNPPGLTLSAHKYKYTHGNAVNTSCEGRMQRFPRANRIRGAPRCSQTPAWMLGTARGFPRSRSGPNICSNPTVSSIGRSGTWRSRGPAPGMPWTGVGRPAPESLQCAAPRTVGGIEGTARRAHLQQGLWELRNAAHLGWHNPLTNTTYQLPRLTPIPHHGQDPNPGSNCSWST